MALPPGRPETMVQGLVSKLALSGFGLVFVVVGLYRLAKGRKQWVRSGRIADTETTQIRDAQPGTVEIKGTAHPATDATLEGPMTGRDALATDVEVEEWESSGQGGGSWETDYRNRDAAPITVDDGTGEVRVELPVDGELNVERTTTEVGSDDEPPEQIRRFLDETPDVDEATRREIGPLSVGDRRRYSEGLIEPSEEVYVLGAAREERAGWGERSLVIDEPTPSGDFVLSDKSESDLIREGRRGGVVSIAFGALLAVVGALVMIYPWFAA